MSAPEKIIAWGDKTTMGVVYGATSMPMQNMKPFSPRIYILEDLCDPLQDERVKALEAENARLREVLDAREAFEAEKTTGNGRRLIKALADLKEGAKK
jgi:hypothetical protein